MVGKPETPGYNETDPECGPTTAKGVSSTRKCGPRLAVTWSAGWWASGRRNREGDGGGCEELRCPEGREVIVVTSPYPRSWLRDPVSKCLQLTLSGTSENNIYADIRRGGVNLLTAFLG